MSLGFLHQFPIPQTKSQLHLKANYGASKMLEQSSISSFLHRSQLNLRRKRQTRPLQSKVMTVSASLEPLDLTEENVKMVLTDARAKFGQIFDDSIGITGVVELAELDGPFVKISLRGRFWHKRSVVVDRLANYLKQRIPEILEVDIEDKKQLDDSPASF